MLHRGLESVMDVFWIHLGIVPVHEAAEILAHGADHQHQRLVLAELLLLLRPLR